MDKMLEVLMSGNFTGIIAIGVIFMLTMSGIMAIVFINYVKKILKDLDNVKDIKPLVDKVEKLVDMIHDLITSHEVTRAKHGTQIETIEEQIKDIYDRLLELEKGK